MLELILKLSVELKNTKPLNTTILKIKKAVIMRTFPLNAERESGTGLMACGQHPRLY